MCFEILPTLARSFRFKRYFAFLHAVTFDPYWKTGTPKIVQNHHYSWRLVSEFCYQLISVGYEIMKLSIKTSKLKISLILRCPLYQFCVDIGQIIYWTDHFNQPQTYQHPFGRSIGQDLRRSAMWLNQNYAIFEWSSLVIFGILLTVWLHCTSTSFVFLALTQIV